MNKILENVLDLVKKHLNAFLAAFLGLFHFILLAIPYLSMKAEVYGMSQKETASGYRAMAAGDMDAGGFLVFMQIVTLLVAIALLALGAYALVRIFLVKNLPGKFGNFTVDKICGLALLAYAVLSVLVLLAVIIVCAANSMSQTMWGVTASIKVRPGFGAFFGMILSVAGAAAPFVLPILNRMAAEKAAAEKGPTCPVCGAEGNKGDEFCPKCGYRLGQ